MNISPEIFKAYDIRGIVGNTLTPEAAHLIGRALAAEALSQQIDTLAVGRDGRLSGPELMAALIRGITETGVDVVDIGPATSPLLYFTAIRHCGGSGVEVTGSHNPAEYNGFKMMLAGEALAGERVQQLLQRIQESRLAGNGRIGSVRTLAPAAEYQDYIARHISLKRPMNIAIDAGNGIAGAFAGDLYRMLGCTVTELYCEVDGHFPHHHPDPAVAENLQDLIQVLRNGDAEIGLAFDGDGDRLGVVTREGNIIYPDRQLMLFAQDALSRHPGRHVVFDVKSSRQLGLWIERHGGVPLMTKTGHSYIKTAIKQHQAILGGEMSGHIMLQENWFGFDDGTYAGARLLEILSAHENPSAVLNALPDSLSTPELSISLPAGSNGHRLIDELAQSAHFEGADRINMLDGLRVEYPDGFGLLRASNTTPLLVMRFEADNKAALTRIQNQFKALVATRPELAWPQ